ncbi:MAG TPA: SCO family protein [Ktedonobacterales bacterium]|jgi:protein SCO1/2
MNWRLASRLAVVVSAILVAILIFVITQAKSAPTLQGTDLGSVAAPDFRLTDQFGNPVSLSQFRGHPVVLTFLYTHCPDTCPLIADKLHLTLNKLGSDASKVDVLAVSTDPEGDDMAAAYQFSVTHHMLNQWHFLIGTAAQLQPVWSSYHVFASAPTPTATGATVDHTVAIYVLDKSGHERVFLAEDFDPGVLANDLRILLSE